MGRVCGAWECLITAAALAWETHRLEIGTLVVNTGFHLRRFMAVLPLPDSHAIIA